MFEQEYKKMFRDVKPSRDLEAETLGLLIEMRDHPPVEAAPTRRLKPFIISAAASLAAVFLLTFIGIGVHQNMLNKRMESELLLDDSVAEDITQDSLFEDEKKGDMDAEAPEQDEEAADSDEDDAADKKEDSAPEDDKDGTANDDKEDDRGSKDEVGNEDKNDDKSDGNQTPPQQDVILEYHQYYYKDDTGAMYYIQNNYPPVENNTGGIRTYLSIKEFADALEKKSTLGYGARYYNARELLIVPTKLPAKCCFRQLYLNHTTGAYTYQYGAAYMGDPYLVTVENKSPRAKSLQELKDQISYLPGEDVQYSIDGNVMTYTFGAETVTVTVTAAVKGAELTDNACRALFNNIDLSRATLDNEILAMTFPEK